MRLTATTLDLLKLELEGVLDHMDASKAPQRVFASATADMPPAERYAGCVLRNTTLNILAVSDGTSWIRQDTGAAIA